MYIGATPQIGGYHKLDQITTDGSASYTMQLNSGNFVPESANHLIVSVNGVIQAPTDSFTVSSSTITFASSLSASDTIDFIMALGNTLDIGTPSDGTISASKLATTSITGQTAETSANDSDSLLIYDDSATALRKMTRSNFLSGVGGTNTPAFSAYLNSNQSIPSTTVTTIAFDVENFDSDGCYSTSTYRFTPTEAGKYLIFANTRLTFTGNNTSDLNLEIRHSVQNSILRISGGSQTQGTWSGSVIATMNGTTDYVFASFYHNDGGAQTLDAGNGDTLFGGFKLIGA